MLEIKADLIRNSDKTIVIIGHSATGKTTLAEYISKLFPQYKVYHTDDYMEYGFKESLYKMMQHLEHKFTEKIIVEGIQGVRLLRKGLETRTFYPDLIIQVTASKATRQERYIKQRFAPEKIRYLNGFDSMLDKIYAGYTAALTVSSSLTKIPRIVKLKTD
jgi:dephospho-CoA kinase